MSQGILSTIVGVFFITKTVKIHDATKKIEVNINASWPNIAIEMELKTPSVLVG